MGARSVGCVALIVLLLLASSQAWAEEPAPAPAPVSKPAPKKHYLRTAIEEALALAAGTTWYWLDRERQVTDWDDPSLSQRLSLDVIRYDNNPHAINFAGHAANGMSFHFLARINGLSLVESIAAGALTSLTWEYVLEYREKISLNDLMITTGSGIALGEFMHVLGRYLNEDPDAAEFAIARWTAGFPAALTRKMDGAAPASLETRPDFHHDLRLAYSFSSAQTEVDAAEDEHRLHGLYFAGEFVTLPGYLDTGVWGTFFKNAEFTKSEMELVFGGKGSATRMYAETTLLGWYNQQIHEDPKFLSNAITLGVPMAYRYRREKAGIWDERVGILHFPGLGADLHLQWRGFSFDASARVNADFAGINALSNEAWEAANPDEQGKSILRKQGYFYGFGGSAALSVKLRYRGLMLGGEVWQGRYKSDQGLDRIQEQLTVDQRASDTLRYENLWLRAEDLPYNLYLGAKISRQERSARLAQFEVSAELTSLTMYFGFAL